MALALAAAWPCAAQQSTWWLAKDGVTAAGRVVALPGWHQVGERHACPPALAVGPRGEAVVTSNALPTLWTIDPDTLRVSLHELELDSDQDKDFGFSSLQYSPDEGATHSPFIKLRYSDAFTFAAGLAMRTVPPCVSMGI